MNVGIAPTFFCFVEGSSKVDERRFASLVTKELTGLGLELFELRFGGTKGRPVLDVRIDRTDGEKVTVDDCARASRAIEAKLDEGNVRRHQVRARSVVAGRREAA